MNKWCDAVDGRLNGQHESKATWDLVIMLGHQEHPPLIKVEQLVETAQPLGDAKRLKLQGTKTIKEVIYG